MRCEHKAHYPQTFMDLSCGGNIILVLPQMPVCLSYMLPEYVMLNIEDGTDHKMVAKVIHDCTRGLQSIRSFGLVTENRRPSTSHALSWATVWGTIISYSY